MYKEKIRWVLIAETSQKPMEFQNEAGAWNPNPQLWPSQSRLTLGLVNYMSITITHGFTTHTALPGTLPHGAACQVELAPVRSTSSLQQRGSPLPSHGVTASSWGPALDLTELPS